MSDYSDVTVTAASEAELQMALVGLVAKYPELDTTRLRARKTSVPGEVQIYVIEGGQS